MRSDSETYKAVAQNCSEYKPCSSSECHCTDSASEGGSSCTNCTHFDHNGAYCKIDLYDKIVTKL